MANNTQYIVVGILSLMLVMTIFQSFQIAKLSSEIGGIRATGAVVTGAVTAAAPSGGTGSSTGGTGSSGTGGLIDVVPKGVPAIYGSELSISFDDISPNDQARANATIEKLAVFDTQIQLTGNLLQRYINIAGAISCEYCCGADSIIFTQNVGQYKAGDAACGCAHSYAMRGLAKYLLTNHANEYTDEQILEELGKWKTLFFPTQITQKASVLQGKGIELTYINLASNKYRGIESSSGGGMVGGC